MSVRVRAYLLSRRLHSKIITVMRAAHNGLWLGALGPAGVRESSTATYERWVHYLDADYNLSGTRDWEQSCIAAHFPATGRVLIGGVGGGREAFALAARGYSVTAFDCTEKLVTAARQLSRTTGTANVEWLVSNPDEVPDVDGTFFAGVIGWGAYMHIQGRSARQRFLTAFASHLEPGAPILISFFVRTGNDRYFEAVRRFSRVTRPIGRWPVSPELGDDLDGSFDHHFSQGEFIEEVSEIGFEVATFGATPYGHAVVRLRADAV